MSSSKVFRNHTNGTVLNRKYKCEYLYLKLVSLHIISKSLHISLTRNIFIYISQTSQMRHTFMRHNRINRICDTEHGLRPWRDLTMMNEHMRNTMDENIYVMDKNDSRTATVFLSIAALMLLLGIWFFLWITFAFPRLKKIQTFSFFQQYISSTECWPTLWTLVMSHILGLKYIH